MQLEMSVSVPCQLQSGLYDTVPHTSAFNCIGGVKTSLRSRPDLYLDTAHGRDLAIDVPTISSIAPYQAKNRQVPSGSWGFER